jgi:hypothetical protein
MSSNYTLQSKRPHSASVLLVFFLDLVMVWYSKEDNVSETRYVSVIRVGVRETYSVVSVRKS